MASWWDGTRWELEKYYGGYRLRLTGEREGSRGRFVKETVTAKVDLDELEMAIRAARKQVDEEKTRERIKERISRMSFEELALLPDELTSPEPQEPQADIPPEDVEQLE